MKHAGEATLDALESLLVRLRGFEGLVERKRGVFYRKGHAFLHFHEDPAGIFAHLKTPRDWERFEITRAVQQRELTKRVRDLLAAD